MALASTVSTNKVLANVLNTITVCILVNTKNRKKKEKKQEVE